MSYEASDWVAALGPRLRGATKRVLWAGANRAGDGGEDGRRLLPGEHNLVTMGTRRWADEADVQRDHLRAILDKLVDHKVLEVALPAAGPRPAWYRFTLRDPDGLPERFSFEPEAAPFNAASHAHATAAKQALQRHLAAPAAPDLVARSDHATSQPPAEAASGTLSEASGTVAGPQWHGQDHAETLNQQPPPSGGRVAGGESNDAPASPHSGPALRQEETTMPSSPAGNGARPPLEVHDGPGHGGEGGLPLAVLMEGGADPPVIQAEPEQARGSGEAVGAVAR